MGGNPCHRVNNLGIWLLLTLYLASLCHTNASLVFGEWAQNQKKHLETSLSWAQNIIPDKEQFWSHSTFHISRKDESLKHRTDAVKETCMPRNMELIGACPNLYITNCWWLCRSRQRRAVQACNPYPWGAGPVWSFPRLHRESKASLANLARVRFKIKVEIFKIIAQW